MSNRLSHQLDDEDNFATILVPNISFYSAMTRGQSLVKSFALRGRKEVCLVLIEAANTMLATN